MVLSGRTWKVLATVGAVSALIAGRALWFRKRSASRAAPAFRFETAKVERGAIRAKGAGAGTVAGSWYQASTVSELGRTVGSEEPYPGLQVLGQALPTYLRHLRGLVARREVGSTMSRAVEGHT